MGTRLLVRALLLGSLALSACSARRIPGTEIDDTPDARAIVELVERYRQAAERRDAATVLALASPKYFDEAGTADPGDDVDYAQLAQRLPEDYARLTAVRLEISVRRVQVDGDKATAEVLYDGRYRVVTRQGEIAKQASDVQRMALAREAGIWKFLSGL